jgi:hypothetical protein
MYPVNRLLAAFSFVIFAALSPGSWGQPVGSTPPPPPPGQVPSPPLEGPATDLDPMPPAHPAQQPPPAREVQPRAGANHDALEAGAVRSEKDRVYAPHEPPPPVSERPSGRRPGPRAQWVPGYWEWDPVAAEFFWVGGVWEMPRPGTLWIAGRWVRGDGGWYRTSGYWSPRRDAAVVRNRLTVSTEPAWRTAGPPASHPADTLAAAPGPDYFFIAGHYAPVGDRLKWKPGFWAPVQPGWDWTPARWVRRPTGWEFRAGHWERETEPADAKAAAGGPATDRIVQKPAAPAGEPSPGGPDADQPPPPPDGGALRDPIAQTEETPAVIVRRRALMPYYVIRPPGLYPYGPGGVVVPGVVPPFVRRILDQVLP